MNTRDVETRHGQMRVVDGDVWVSKSLDELGEYSQSELISLSMLFGVMRQHRSSPIVVVEAGAYIGDLTVPISRLVDRVVAFEPQAEIRSILEHNLSTNQCTNVDVLPYALGHECGVTTYQTDPLSPGSTMMATGDSPAQVVTLDSLGLDVDFIKADVEGMEILLLAGAQETLERCRPVLFLERDTVSLPRQPSLDEVLQILGYSYHHLIFPLYMESNWRGAPNPFGSTASLMTLGIPQ